MPCESLQQNEGILDFSTGSAKWRTLWTKTASRTAKGNVASNNKPDLLPTFLDQRIQSEPAVGVARGTDGYTRRNLVLTLNRLALRGGHVGRKRHKETSGHPLLNRDVSARRPLAAASC